MIEISKFIQSELADMTGVGPDLRLSELYPTVLEKLVENEADGVVIFRGAPLEYQFNHRQNGYVQPVLVTDNNGFSVFNVISLNNDGAPIKDFSQVPIVVSSAPDVLIKLQAIEPEVNLFNQLLHGPKKQVLIKLSNEANVAFPLFNMPGYDEPDRETLISRLKKLHRALGIVTDPPQIEPSNFYKTLEIEAELGKIFLMKPIPVATKENGIVLASLAYCAGDPWKYYWIFSYTPPLDLAIANQNSTRMRVDSGCDSGMILGDQGCECHAQLINALTEIRDKNGIIIHIPAQDGRGYGTVTKLETEALKQGAPSATFPFAGKPRSTIAAAMDVLGESNFDLRTYGGVGLLLHQLGFRSIEMITDNKIKVAGVAAGSDHKLKVHRVPTLTLEKNCSAGLAEHVRSKHSSDLYYE